MATKPKLTGQQEKFCREYVRCGVAARAYRAAYNVGARTKPETVHRKAFDVLHDGKVTARIGQLQAQAAKRAGFTVESAIVELDQNLHLARDLDQIGAANQAIMGKARVAGLLKDADDGGSKGINVSIVISATDAGLL